jgi:hypothetical protein
MPNFYHVDRAGRLNKETELGLFQTDRHVNFTSQSPELDERVETLMQNYFSDGISLHGKQYSSKPAKNSSYHYEYFFEIIRRAEFPNRISRFQAFFGCKSIEDAEAFIENKIDTEECNPIIWKVKTDEDSYFKADMRLLPFGTFSQGVAQAHTYWEGNSYREDPFWEILMDPNNTEIIKKIQRN